MPAWLLVLQRLALVDKFKLKSASEPSDESFAGGLVEDGNLDWEIQIFIAAKAFVKVRGRWPDWAFLWKKTLEKKIDAATGAVGRSSHVCSWARFTAGDVVVGMAKGKAGVWHGRRCKILNVLGYGYKVKMLEGPRLGEEHKYYFHCVEAPDDATVAGVAATDATVAAEAAATGAPGAAATGAAEAAAILKPGEAAATGAVNIRLQELKDLFGED